MITWNCKKFDELTTRELYAIIQLRNEVFVVEQNCVYQDADDIDLSSFHFMGWQEDRLAAYTRIIPPGVVYAQVSIGRVVTSPIERRTGLGRELMKLSIQQVYELFGNLPIRIGAQQYLQTFYITMGFQIEGETYLLDGIEHIEMVKP